MFSALDFFTSHFFKVINLACTIFAKTCKENLFIYVGLTCCCQ